VVEPERFVKVCKECKTADATSHPRKEESAQIAAGFTEGVFTQAGWRCSECGNQTFTWEPASEHPR
jgi:hypothetical protein